MILATEDAESEKNQETRKAENSTMEAGTGNCRQGDHCCGRRLLGVPGFLALLLVGNRGARWARKMDDFETLEADFAAPFFKIGGGIIERVAEFDQHV